MVMHARKIARISDGFNDKHQAHSYENSKYTSTKYRYSNHEKRDSPSANSLRSLSPDSRSQSPRYHKVSYYKCREKDRDKDRDRDRERDREYRDYRDRDGSRSPKERRRERDRERDHRDGRSTHDRVNSVHKKDEKERSMRVGDWSEHISSSGKKYYYNCRTEVSQWEKPTEWLEWERNHRPCPPNKELPLQAHRTHDKTRQDKHSTSNENYRDSREAERERRDSFRNDTDLYERRDTRKCNQDTGTADMEISSGDSTPTSESQLEKDVNSEGMLTSGNFPSLVPTNRLKLLPTSLSVSLPNTSIPNTSSYSTLNSNMSVGMPQILNSHPRLMSLAGKGLDHEARSLVVNSHSVDGEKPQLDSVNPVTSSSIGGGGGPPTPTHSEIPDNTDGRKVASPTSGLNSLQSLNQASGTLSGLKSEVPELTPSLASCYKDSLIAHVQSWPAESFEKQAQWLTVELHNSGSLKTTQVSAELKKARSVVRLAEIQATLHEQRILFLRAQKSELEDMKSHNYFMTDT